MREEMLAALKEIEEQHERASERQRRENQKLIAEITATGSTLTHQLRVFPFMAASPG